MHKEFQRIKACALATIMLCAAFLYSAPVSHAEESILELQAQYDKLETQIAANQKKIEEK